jgi:hypothetical protein
MFNQLTVFKQSRATYSTLEPQDGQDWRSKKPFEARVEDMMEDERQKEQEKTDTKPVDNDDTGIDTSAFLMTEMKFGLDFVF